VRSIYQHRKRTIAKLNLIWDRNHQIRAALEAISPHPHTSRNQQSIRVIREETTRLDNSRVIPTMQEHLGIIAAFEVRDPERASTAMVAHIDKTRKRALGII